MTRTTPAPRWDILALVFAATALNYVDRQILALLKPTLETEFAWSDRDFAHLGSAFQFAAALAFLGAGWFVDRLGLRRGYAIGVAVWSVAGMAHAAAASVGQFVVARVTLGAAESVNTPAAVKAAAEYFPTRGRSLAIGLVNTAPNVGAIATPLLIPPLALAFGWHAAFLVPGGLGFLWLVLWLRRTRADRPADVITHPQPVAPWATIARDRRTIAIAGAKALTDQVWWFLLFWTPDFFNRQFHLGQGELGLPVALVYAMAAAGALTAGGLFPWLLARGRNVLGARLLAMLLFALLVLPVPLVLSVASPWSAALILGLALFAHQGFSTNIFGLATDVTPSTQVATVIGIGAFCGNIAGLGMLELAGWSLDRGHGYAPMFAISAISYLLAVAWVRALLLRLRGSAA